jgi:hypothetical protein
VEMSDGLMGVLDRTKGDGEGQKKGSAAGSRLAVQM